MGKYKNFRKRNKSKAKEVLRGAIEPASTKIEPRTLHSDLISLDDYRRLNACRLLSNIFGFSSNNTAVIEKLMGSDIISRLIMRLLDSNRSVQYEAIGAVGNLAKSIDISKLSGHIISCGTITTLTSIPLDFSNVSTESDNLIIQLLTSLSALISCDEEIAIAFSNNMILSLTPASNAGNFLCNLVQHFSTSTSSSVIESVADFLLVITDGLEDLCKYLASIGLITKIYQQINHILVSMEASIASVGTESATLPACRSFGIALKYLSVLVNLSQYMTDNEFTVTFEDTDKCISKLLSSSIALFATVQPEIITQLNLQVTYSTHLKKSAKPQEATTNNTESESTAMTSEVTTALSTAREPLYSFAQVLAETIGNLSFALGERYEAAQTPAVTAVVNQISASFVHRSFIDNLGASIAQISDFIQRNGATVAFVEGASYDTRALTVELSIALEMTDKFSVAFANILALHQFTNQHMKVCLFDPIGFQQGFIALTQAIDIYFSTAQKAHSSSEIVGKATEETEIASTLTDTTPTTANMDSDEKDDVPQVKDPTTEMIDYAEIHEMAVSVTCSTLNALSSLYQDANTSTLKSLPVDCFQSLCLHLCKGITNNFRSVTKTCLELLAQIAARDNEQITTGAVLTSDSFIITYRLNALFTNALVRKLESLRQLPYCDSAHLQLAGMCTNALIDLHSSDDDKVLDTYVKFKLGDVLKSARLFCKNALVKRHSDMIMDEGNAVGDDVGGEFEQALDDNSLDSMIQEIMENAKNLIDYKKSFLKSRGV